jgi:hypothetical protein
MLVIRVASEADFMRRNRSMYSRWASKALSKFPCEYIAVVSGFVTEQRLADGNIARLLVCQCGQAAGFTKSAFSV